MRRTPAGFLMTTMLLVAACGDKTGADDSGAITSGTGGGAAVDADADGYTTADDCDDADAAVSPAAVEVCDGVDNDCDGLVDDADDSLDLSSATSFWRDDDGDGYGNPDVPLTACVLPVDAAATGDDCDDAQPTVYPDALELCDGLDNDCDGLVDDDDPQGADDAPSWYVDADGDGFGGPDSATVSCVQPAATVADGTDCDDAAAWVWPGAPELCDGEDTDCDAATDETELVSWQIDGAAPTDVTAGLLGTADAPAAFVIDTPGTLRFCEGTHYVGLDVHADAAIVGVSEDPSLTILDAALGGSVVQIEGEGLDVSISGLTLTHGYGELGDTLGEGEGGGVFCESLDTSSSLSLDAVVVDANQGVMAGGMFTHLCDTTVTNTEFSGNTAQDIGGGGWIMGGSHAWSQVDVSDNVTDGDVGGFYFYALSGDLDLVFDEVWVHDNVASNGVAAGLAVMQGTLSWTGTTKTNSGLQGNVALSQGGGMHLFGTDFSADTVDFGEPGTDNDNRPADIFLDDAITPYGAGDDATFSCVDGECGRNVVHEVGEGDTPWVSVDGYLVADVFEATTVATLEQYLFYGSAEDGCEAQGVVLSADSPTEESTVSWTEEWSGRATSWDTSTAWNYVEDVNVLTEIGRTYAVGFVCECTTGTYCYAARPADGPTTFVDAGFGEGTGMLFEGAFDGSSAYLYGSAYLSWFNLRLDVTEL